MKFETEQEKFWAEQFGDNYVERNGYCKIPARIVAFSKVLTRTENVHSFLELGANVGSNEVALRTLKPESLLSAVEINKSAYMQLAKLPGVEAYNESILDFEPAKTWDFVFTAGVLIHIDPKKLDLVYEKMYRFSKKYIWMNEYYSPYPVEVEYRGNAEKLFKRDFAGELMDKYPNLKLVDYGFGYHRDKNFPIGDSNWFLLEKTV